MKKNLLLASAITIFALFSGYKTVAQTLEDARNTYNAARELSKTDMAAAVAKMNEALGMCIKVGPDADELKGNMIKVLPNWQFAVASKLLNDQNNLDPKDRNFTKPITEFEKSLDLATKYSDNSIAEKANAQIEDLNYKQGLMMLQKDSADKAIAYFDKALKINPQNTKLYLNKARAMRKKGDVAATQSLLEQTIDVGTKQNDTISVKNAKSLLGSLLLVQGQTSFKSKLWPDAITKLNESLKYAPNKEAYYMMAVASNKIKKFDDAIAAANAAMPLDEQTDLKLARYYFELGNAYQGKKDIENACASYKKASFGPYVEAAKFQITQMKCK